MGFGRHKVRFGPYFAKDAAGQIAVDKKISLFYTGMRDAVEGKRPEPE
jgi:hypothetical protein